MGHVAHGKTLDSSVGAISIQSNGEFTLIPGSAPPVSLSLGSPADGHLQDRSMHSHL